MTLREKVGLLEKLQEGISYNAVTRWYNMNDSTIRDIMKKEEEIYSAVLPVLCMFYPGNYGGGCSGVSDHQPVQFS